MKLQSLFVLIATFVIAGSAQAQIGSGIPRTDGNHRFSLGVGAENTSRTWMPYDVHVDRAAVYLEGTISLVDEHFEGFLRVGGANPVFNAIETYEPGWARDSSSNMVVPFGSIGLRGTLFECGRWSLGTALEIGITSGFEETKNVTSSCYQQLLFENTIDVTIGLPLARRFGSNCDWVVYGGPSLHFGYAEADVRTVRFDNGGASVSERIQGFNARDKAGIGGFVGIEAPISAHWRLGAEGQYMEGGYGVGLSVFRKF